MTPRPDGLAEWLGFLLWHPWPVDASTTTVAALLGLGVAIGRWSR